MSGFKDIKTSSIPKISLQPLSLTRNPQLKDFVQIFFFASEKSDVIHRPGTGKTLATSVPRLLQWQSMMRGGGYAQASLWLISEFCSCWQTGHQRDTEAHRQDFYETPPRVWLTLLVLSSPTPDNASKKSAGTLVAVRNACTHLLLSAASNQLAWVAQPHRSICI